MKSTILIIALLFCFNALAGNAIIKIDGTAVHIEPKASSKVLSTLKVNTVIEVSDVSYYGWHNTTVNGKKGYIHANTIIMSDDSKVEEVQDDNPFDLTEKAVVHYFFDFSLVPLGRAGQQFHSGITLKLGYENETFERGATFYYGMGLGKYRIKVASLLADFGWKFTRYTTIGVMAGYEYLKFSSLEVQKSSASGRSYRAPLDPRGFVYGGFMNQKIIGDSLTFVFTEGALLETYNIERYNNSDIYYDNPAPETRQNVKKSIYLFLSFGIRFSI
jgi:hypothetical protein